MANIRNVVRILRVFHICSGLKINIKKSSIFAIGVLPNDLSSMAEIVGCQAGTFPFKYLGVMVGANMNRMINWKPVYDTFDVRLAKWKAGILSIAGRITLIKAVLESLPNYYFSLYKAPVKVIKDLEAKMRNFLWGGDGSVKKTSLGGLGSSHSSVKKGGLGLSKLKNANTTLLSKWGWRFLSNLKNLWSRVIEAIHNNRNCGDFVPVKNSIGGVWSNIVKVLNNTVIDGTQLKYYFKVAIGNGDNTKFWLDHWIGPRTLKEAFRTYLRSRISKISK
ncbi:putative RNA-directed DNA polymerase [Helianthus annuus]|nr:putative RNA-directed DNA polymerase [Helianthus annuus]KAJ0675005.1 putative RNA-directed DNA polymerase [Helianthus annuus]KAJ0866560.1 putative RNA-directed DNA polymerase [Helianthus annuus]